MNVLKRIRENRLKRIQKNLESIEKQKIVEEKQKTCSHTFTYFDTISTKQSSNMLIKYLIIVKFCPKCNFSSQHFINITI